MSSPGAGKTTLLKRTISALASTLRLGVLEGDIATSSMPTSSTGSVRPSRSSTPVPDSVASATSTPRWPFRLGRLPLEQLDMLVIENVGNFVCPAEFNIGEDARAMVYAVTEGEDKPLKYPVMFHVCDVVVVNKIDLLAYLDFDLELFVANLRAVNPTARLIELSARTGEGMGEWCDWLRETRASR